MTELFRHIGPDTDVPAGDIGVGGREIGYLFGQYKRIRNEFTGVLTGKGLNWGGSLIRPEATGYGAVYFAEEMLDDARRDARGQDLPRVRLRQRGPVHGREAARARRASPSRCPTPAAASTTRPASTREKLAFVMDLKNVRRGRISEYADKFKGAEFTPADPKADHNPLWDITADCAFPSATQNEINAQGRREPAEQRRATWSARAPTCRPSPTASSSSVDGEHPLRPRQGRQRRRRGHLRPGDVAEQPAPRLDARGSGRRACTAS